MDNNINNQPNEAEIADRISASALEERREQIKPSWSMGSDDPAQYEHEAPYNGC